MEHVIQSVVASILTKLIWWRVELLFKQHEDKTKCVLCHYLFDIIPQSFLHPEVCTECATSLDKLVEGR